MCKFKVIGGNKLQGEVWVQGSKNAAFPVIAACVLAEGTSRIENVPDISDVRNILKILDLLGAEYSFENHVLIINTDKLQNKDLSRELMGKLRGSILFAGALLARMRKLKMAYPGGDAIGKRPIDQHLEGFKLLGAKIQESQSFLEIRAPHLVGNKIVLGVTTVTGTENLILVSVLTPGVTEIRLAATEPHVQSLCRFLNQMGAKIEGIGTPFLKIIGVKKLRATNFALEADEIDAVTFCAAAAATDGHVAVRGANLSTLDAPLAIFQRIGVNFEAAGSTIEIKEPKAPYHGTRIVTGVYPRLLTDEQPLFGVLATKAVGETSIHDWIWEGRLGYLKILQEMGAKVEFGDVHRARVYGPTELQGMEIKTPDIRAGASILIAALIAKGQSILYNAEIIDRGYERIDERLRTLGAKIERIE